VAALHPAACTALHPAACTAPLAAWIWPELPACLAASSAVAPSPSAASPAAPPPPDAPLPCSSSSSSSSSSIVSREDGSTLSNHFSFTKSLNVNAQGPEKPTGHISLVPACISQCCPAASHTLQDDSSMTPLSMTPSGDPLTHPHTLQPPTTTSAAHASTHPAPDPPLNLHGVQ